MKDGNDGHPANELLTAGASLEDLAEGTQSCRSCGLYAHATQAVFGSGPADASLMLVGEQPGDREDVEGEPFVGPAGRLLDAMLEEAEIDRGSVFVTNTVKHFKWKPGTGPKPRLHATPKRGEVVACRPWLDAEMARVRPAVVVCLGAVAVRELMGTGARVTRDRGDPVEIAGRIMVATYHPSAVLRARNDRVELHGKVVEDLRIAAELAGLAQA